MMRPVPSYIFRPLTGFGWIGALGAVVLAIMIYGLLVGFDFHHMANKIVLRFFGVDAMMYTFTGLILPAHSLSLLTPMFGLIGAMLLTIALFISPRPVAWWHWSLVSAWGLGEVVLQWKLVGWIGARIQSASSTDWSRNFTVAHGMVEIVSIALVWLTTRSALPTMAVATIAAAGVANQYALSLTPTPGGSWAVPELFYKYGYHTLLAIPLLGWAIIARYRAPRSGQCQLCGYDLFRNTSCVCPECGSPTPTA